MSSTMTIDAMLIGTSNIVPEQMMNKVFLSCVEELGGAIQSNTLVVQGKRIGSITFGKRIVLRYTSSTRSLNPVREEVRSLFTRRIAIAQTDYLNELAENERRLRESRATEESLLAELAAIERQKQKSLEAMERQNKPSCEAIKEELCEAAEAKGYDVVEETTDQGLHLQFIRREY